MNNIYFDFNGKCYYLILTVTLRKAKKKRWSAHNVLVYTEIWFVERWHFIYTKNSALLSFGSQQWKKHIRMEPTTSRWGQKGELLVNVERETENSILWLFMCMALSLSVRSNGGARLSVNAYLVQCATAEGFVYTL